MKHALFYGSLKKQEFNFDRFGKGSQRYIKTLELNGFDLYDLTYYPGLTKGKGKVVAELHEVDDDAFKNIERMERGAGYKEEQIEVDGVKASIFFFKGDLSRFNKIESGNWTGK